MVFNTTFNNIHVISWGVSFSCGGNQSPQRKPTKCHSQTLSHNVVSSTHRLRGIWTHNVSGDRHWLHM